jgi:hypothetical protein
MKIQHLKTKLANEMDKYRWDELNDKLLIIEDFGTYNRIRNDLLENVGENFSNTLKFWHRAICW